MKKLILILAVLLAICLPSIALSSGIDSYLTHVTIQRSVDDTLLWVERTGVSDSLLWLARWAIPVSPASHNFGTVVESGIYSTGTDNFTLTNYGEEDIDISISAGSMTGGTPWTLSDTATPGSMIYGLKAGLPPGADGTTSIVGTSTTNEAIWYPFQRKTFYANGRYWVFFTDGTNYVYRTATEDSPSSWSSSTTLKSAAGWGEYLSVTFDGTYLHYAFADHTPAGNPIYYRRGVPEGNDGTITWSAAEQTAVSGQEDIKLLDTRVVVDSNGYPFISYKWWDEVGGERYPYVTKASTNDGTWSTASGFPYQLSTTDDNTWYTSLVAMNTEMVYIAYTRNFQQAKGRLWNGSMSSEETITSSAISRSTSFDITNNQNDIHFTFTKQTSNNIVHTERIYEVGWGSEDTVQVSTTEWTSAALSIAKSTSVLYCFWASPSTDHVYYKKRVNGTWDISATDWIDEETDDIATELGIGAYENNYDSNYIGVVYITKTASPFNIKHNYLSVDNYGITVTSSGASFISDLAADNSQDWGMEFYAPTVFIDPAEKTGIVTLTASLS